MCIRDRGLTARQGGGALAQGDVTKAHVHQGLQLAGDLGHVGKEGAGLLHRHVQHVRDALALVLDLQRLPVVARALAHLAGHEDVRQKVHLDLHDAVALAGFAPAALHVEAEPAGTVAPHLGVLGLGKDLSLIHIYCMPRLARQARGGVTRPDTR